jgi:hypothetical protein
VSYNDELQFGIYFDKDKKDSSFSCFRGKQRIVIGDIGVVFQEPWSDS